MESSVRHHHGMGIAIVLGLIAAFATAAAFAAHRDFRWAGQPGVFDEWEDFLGI